MARPIDQLPEEYRTPSLESLPEDLQALAVAKIQKRFKIKAIVTAAREDAFKQAESLYERVKKLSTDWPWSPPSKSFDSYAGYKKEIDPSLYYGRRYKVHVDCSALGICRTTYFDVDERDVFKLGEDRAVRSQVYNYLASHNGFNWDTDFFVEILNG